MSRAALRWLLQRVIQLHSVYIEAPERESVDLGREESRVGAQGMARQEGVHGQLLSSGALQRPHDERPFPAGDDDPSGVGAGNASRKTEASGCSVCLAYLVQA